MNYDGKRIDTVAGGDDNDVGKITRKNERRKEEERVQLCLGRPELPFPIHISPILVTDTKFLTIFLSHKIPDSQQIFLRCNALIWVLLLLSLID